MMAARLRRHGSALAVCCSLAIIWTYPLVLHLGTDVPGTEAGDNVQFLWNLWWMREALASDTIDFFRTTRLFHPYGVALVQDTHTALHAFVAATLLGGQSIVTAQGWLILASLALAAYGAYLLAFDLWRHHRGALFAGAAFGGSPYVLAHLWGQHFNLTSVWGLPFLALAVRRAFDHGSRAWAVGTGVALAAVAWQDSYYALYGLFFLSVWLIARSVGVRITCARSELSPRARALLGGGLAANLATAAWIATSGGTSFAVAGFQVSMRDPLNHLTAAWIFSAVWVWRRWRPRPTVVVDTARLRGDLSIGALAVAVSVAIALPLVLASVDLWKRGDLVPATRMWRSPLGVDAAALVLGNPLHPVYGAAVRALYARFDINVVESAAWIGVVPLVLLWRAGRGREDAAARIWWVLAACFLLWALGPHLRVLGVNTGLVLPQMLARLVPIVADARVPGRAMVVVYLAVAVLVARSVARGQGAWARPVAQYGLLLLVVVDYLGAPVPLTRLDYPRVYAALATLPAEGAVCEIPLGYRDGWIARGGRDERVLFYQTLHRKPIVGGLVSRLPSRIQRAYDADEAIGPLLRLSEGETLTPAVIEQGRARAQAALRRNGVAYLVINRATAPEPLMRYVESVFDLTLLARDGARDLYRVRR
jgi:hypothetical protein